MVFQLSITLWCVCLSVCVGSHASSGPVLYCTLSVAGIFCCNSCKQPNSCKVPSFPPWTNSCRSCPLRCARTLHCLCASVSLCALASVRVCVPVWKMEGTREQNSLVDWAHDANDIHAFFFPLPASTGASLWLLHHLHTKVVCQLSVASWTSTYFTLMSQEGWVRHESGVLRCPVMSSSVLYCAAVQCVCVCVVNLKKVSWTAFSSAEINMWCMPLNSCLLNCKTLCIASTV